MEIVREAKSGDVRVVLVLDEFQLVKLIHVDDLSSRGYDSLRKLIRERLNEDYKKVTLGSSHFLAKPVLVGVDLIDKSFLRYIADKEVEKALNEAQVIRELVKEVRGSLRKRGKR